MPRKYWYKGEYTTKGEVWNDLTFEEYNSLVQQEAAYDQQKAVENAKKLLAQQEQANATALAPAVNEGISSYVRETGTGGTVAAGFPENLPSKFKSTAATSPEQQQFDAIIANKKDAAQGISGAKNLPMPAVEERAAGQPKLETQDLGNSALLRGLPPEMVTPLLIQYRAGITRDGKKYGPVEFFDDVKKMRTTYQSIAEAERKAKLESELKTGEMTAAQKAQAERELATGKQKGEDDLAGERIKAASAEKIAAGNIEADKAKRESDAYNKRTAALKTPELDDINNLRNAVNSLDVIENLFDEKFVGFVKGREGTVKSFLGTLGEDATKFRQAVDNASNTQIKSTSGATVTGQEYARISKELVNYNVAPEQFKSMLAANKQMLKNRLATVVDSYKRAGRDTSQFDEFTKGLNLYEMEKRDAGAPEIRNSIYARARKNDAAEMQNTGEDDDALISRALSARKPTGSTYADIIKRRGK